MNDLEVCQHAGPPATLEELSQFLLIAPEKAAAMRAEIRAIKKAGLAAEVYMQKLEEQRRLSELILDASVLLGDIAKTIPKINSNQHIAKVQSDSAVHLQKTKTDTLQQLGFSPKQVQRFETLADNKDLVELEKAKAREEGRMPTRTNVIDMAQERKRRADAERSQIERDFGNLKLFRKAVSFAELYQITDDILDSVVEADSDLPATIQDLNDLIGTVAAIRDKLTVKGANHGKRKPGRA